MKHHLGPPPTADTGRFAVTFRRFRQILAANTRVLETIGEMERALGGEYVFDRAFLRDRVNELLGLIREVIYNLNALADQGYPGLYDRFEAIGNHLTDLVTGGPGPYDHRLTLSYSLLHRDLDYLVGAKNATLGELANHLRLPTPDGFAITAEAYRLLLASDDLGSRIDAVLAGPGSAAEKAGRIAPLIDAVEVPEALTSAVAAELDALRHRLPAGTRLAVRSSAIGEDSASRSFAGQFASVLDVEPSIAAVEAAYRRVVASRFGAAAIDYLGGETAADRMPMAVGVQALIPAAVAGVVYSRDPAADGDHLVISAVAGGGGRLVGGEVTPDRYLLARRHPFALLTSEIRSQPEGGPDPLAITDNGLRRGSALLSRPHLVRLAETALLLEKTFNGPQDIEWALAGNDLVFLQCRPLALPPQPRQTAAAVAAELRHATLLAEGHGQIAQLGIAAGQVRHVTPESDPDNFPVGAIAVSRDASPQLSPIVRRAAAIITDVGGPTGHLATIAREYRTPALFGTGNASTLLAEGDEVTIDVETRQIYAGRIESLVQMEAAVSEPYQETAEYRTLRRLLRWTAPLTLVDPTSPGFTPENCQTFHDIIRFCHEKAVASLIHFHSSGRSTAGLAGRRLTVDLPLALTVIDLDGGLADGAPADTVSVDQVRSRPLRCLLRGLGNQSAWEREPAPFGFKDLLSSLSRPLSSLVHAPAYEGENLAIIASDYCNLSLRLGYHFNVIDTLLTDIVEDNYIYFRFVGGFAEEAKRLRRAELIGAVLTSLHFKVERQGDLLIGKAKMTPPEEMESTLERLGMLIAFTRQLDVRLDDDAAVERFFSRFIEQIGAAAGRGGQ